MTNETLGKAITEAERFLEEARAVKATATLPAPNGYVHLTAGPKETGSLRRRSMDLTRALAEMRKS